MGGVFYSQDCKSKISKCLFKGNVAKKVASWTVNKKNGDFPETRQKLERKTFITDKKILIMHFSDV